MSESPRVLGNRYEVAELLGRGGMAEVHLGRDARLGRTVAIKLLRTDLARDPLFQARFRREAQSAAALNHPAIVAVYDTGEEQVTESGGAVVNLPYIVMEHIEGRTLREGPDPSRQLSPEHHLSVEDALDITAGVLTALEYSHRIGIVHRDIKPANVMLTPTGDVKVMDFGIARAMSDASSTMTQTQAVIGTAQYLSPEQARGEAVDTRSDLYSTGCLLFELLTGRPPFVADSPVAVAYQHVREQPIPPSQLVPGIPEAVDRVVLHSLGKGREDRYQTAAEFRADVEAARGGQQVAAQRVAALSSGAATQYVPGPADTGTRALGPVGAGGLLGQPVGEASPFEDPYDTYGQDHGRRTPQKQSSRGPLIAGLIVVLLLLGVGFAVYKLVSDGSKLPQVTVQDVTGKTEIAATAALEGDGFKVNPVTQKVTDADDDGKVLSQDPTGQSKAEQGSTITITVGQGPEQVEIPDVEGLTVNAAKNTLTAEGFEVDDTLGREASTTVDAGKVTRTDPEAGEMAAQGATIKIYVATVGNVTVPNLNGLTRTQAQTALQQAGLVGRFDQETSAEETPNRVFAQTPEQGSTVKKGSTVRVVIAVAPETEPTGSATPTESPTPTESETDEPPVPTAT